MSTPSGSTVWVHDASGKPAADVTEGVQALYDHLVGSMNWGSGFLAIEDAAGIIRVAQACGFLVPRDAAKEFESYAQSCHHSERIVCVTCGERVHYVWGRYRTTEPDRWKHEGADPGHEPLLWPTEAGVS